MDREQEQAYRLSARRRAMNLLARREHTRRELFQKLKTRLKVEAVPGASESDDVNDAAAVSEKPDALINQVLDQLESDGLLSEARFIESYVTARKNKGYGPLYIRHQLKSRDVAEAGAHFVADVDNAQWLDALLLFIGKRLSFALFPQRATQDYMRLQRFVLSRGYSVAQWLQAEQLYQAGSAKSR